VNLHADPLAAASRLVTQLHDLDVEPPADAAAALLVRKAALTAANRDPSQTLSEAVEQGTVTEDNVADLLLEAARDKVARDVARSLLRDNLNGPLGKRALTAIREDADRIISDLRPAFDTAAEGITQATFPPDTTPEKIVRLGPDATAAHNALEGHAATLDRIRGVRLALPTPPANTPTVALFLHPSSVPDATALTRAHALYTANHRSAGRVWHALTAAGYTLRLNTADETQALIDQTEEHSRRTQAADRQRERERNQREAKPYVDAWKQTVGSQRD
jgi:hypothetical protein